MIHVKDQSIYNYKDKSLRSPELKENIEKSFNELLCVAVWHKVDVFLPRIHNIIK